MQEPIVTKGQFSAIIELQSVDSTNNYALKLIREDLAYHGLAVFTHEQWAGKGQRGKIWVTAKGENILMSTILDAQHFPLQEQFLLSALVAIAVRNFLEQYAQSDLTIKWPNDIFFQDRKMGGILIENLLVGANWKWAVAGTGININQTHFDPTIKNAVSLKQITGKHFDCRQLADGLRQEIVKTIADMPSGSTAIMNRYNQHLFKKNTKAMLLHKDGALLECTINHVTGDGKLCVTTDKTLFFDFGEVSWVL